MAFREDSNYYHTFVEFPPIRGETPKSYLIHINNVDVWIPKKICKEFTGISAYIHTEILEKNLAAAKKKAGAWRKEFRPKNENSIMEEKTFNLDTQQFKHLISLCHPDKHNNSKIANNITAVLLKKR